MTGQLAKVPVAHWIRGTIEKMNRSGVEDSSSWASRWIETYYELGGQSDESGKKACPRAAGYGLWQLGRIRDGGKPWKDWSLTRIRQEFGKNATYAVLALQLLDNGANSRDPNIWDKVRSLYQQQLGEDAAQGEQGEIRLACILFDEGLIVTQ
jgi:hypothetical protein